MTGLLLEETHVPDGVHTGVHRLDTRRSRFGYACIIASTAAGRPRLSSPMLYARTGALEPRPETRRLNCMKRTLLIVASFLILSACSADADQPNLDGGNTLPESPTSTVSSRIGDTEWILTSGSIDGTALVLVDGSPVTLRQEASGISGRSACNSYGAQLNETGGPLFEEMFSTAMACADPRVNELEILATRGLMRVTEAELDGGDLVFLGGGVELRFRSTEPTLSVALEGTEWVLDSLIQGESVSTPAAPSDLTITATELEGDSGCNGFGARLTIDGATLDAEVIETEEEGCSDSIMRQEALIYRVLGSRPIWQIEGSTLTIETADEGLIYKAP